VFRYRGTDVDVREIGRELNVKYVVEGSVQKVGDEYRVTLQLIETASGAHLWVDSRDVARPQDLHHHLVERIDLFRQPMTTPLTFAIASDITPQGSHIRTAEGEEFEAFLDAIPDEDLLTWVNLWQVRNDLEPGVQATGAMRIGERAIERRGQEPLASALLAFVLASHIYIHPAEDRDGIVRTRIATLVERALRRPAPDVAGIAVQSLYFIGHWKRGYAIVRTLRMRNSALGDILRALVGGEAEAVVGEARQQIADGVGLAGARPVGSLAAAVIGDYETALQWSEEYVLLYGMDYRPHKTRILSLVMLGRLDEARRAYAEFQAAWPGVNLADELSQYVCEHRDVSGLNLNSPAGHFFAYTMPDALRRAGVEVPPFNLGTSES